MWADTPSKFLHHACRACWTPLALNSSVIHLDAGSLVEAQQYSTILRSIVNVEDRHREEESSNGWLYNDIACSTCRTDVGAGFVQVPDDEMVAQGMGMLHNDKITFWNGCFYEDYTDEDSSYYLCQCGMFLAFHDSLAEYSGPSIVATDFKVDNVKVRPGEQDSIYGPFTFRNLYCTMCDKCVGYRSVHVRPDFSSAPPETVWLMKSSILKKERNQILDAVTLQPALIVTPAEAGL